MFRDFVFKIIRFAIEWHQNRIYKNYREKYSLHSKFRFNGKDILLYGEGDIIFGANSYVGDYSTWQAADGFKIVVGEYCQISHNVRCYTESMKADHDFSMHPIPIKRGDVIISDYVWIGANVFINPGVKIGRNSVIGANSVVTKDVLENSIVGGVPARLIRYKNTTSV